MRIDLAEALFNAALVGGSGGGSVTVQPLSVSSNGTYSAPSGFAYSPVDVNVSGGGGGATVEAQIIERTISGDYANSLVNVVGSYAFYRCISLTGVDLPNATKISDYAFQMCNLLRSANFPNVTRVGQFAFNACASLSTVNLPAATALDTSAFATCTSLLTVSLPHVSSLAAAVFNGCSRLTEVHLPEFSYSYVPTSCFQSCYMMSSITGVEDVTLISASAFCYCSSLTKAIFSHVTSIGANAFNSCAMLSEVSLPELKTISSNAFTRCSSLMTISLPKCTAISANAFSWCASLYSVYLLGSTKVSLQSTSVFAGTPIVSTYHSEPYGSVFVPSSLYAEYIADSVWGILSARIVSM